MRFMRAAAALGATAVGATALAAMPAGASILTKSSAHFEATVSGTQTTEWKEYRNDPPAPCSIGYKGGGAERVVFSSTTPAKLEVWAYRGLPLTVKRLDESSRLPSLPVRAKIKRRGTWKSWDNSPGRPCGGGGSGTPPPMPKPDCGTKTATWNLELGSAHWGNGVRVADGSTRTFEVFHNCPVGEFGFPAILTGNRFGREIVGHLSPRDAFNPRRRTITTVGHGTLHFKAGYETSYTTIEWTVTLHRMR